MFNSKKIITFIEKSQEPLNENSSTLIINNYDEIIPTAQILSCLNNLQSCAYINLSISSHPQISLLEQLFLRTQLKKEYPYIHIDYYMQSRRDSITRGIVAQAEFQNLPYSKLIEYIKYHRYDYIILDNVTSNSNNFSLISAIVNDENISSQIILIGDSKIKSHFNNIDTYFTYQNKIKQFSNLDKSSSLEEKNFYQINSPKNISVWIQIAYNFIFLKKNISKRFFFLSTQIQNSREIAFISILKKILKSMNEFGNWDFINLNIDNVYLPSSKNSNEEKLNMILKQSFHINGFTNIIVDSRNTISIDNILNIGNSKISSIIIVNDNINVCESDFLNIELLNLNVNLKIK